MSKYSLSWELVTQYEEGSIYITHESEGFEFVVISGDDSTSETDGEEVISDHLDNIRESDLAGLVAYIKLFLEGGALQMEWADNNVTLSFQKFDYWHPNVDPETFYNILVDKISEVLGREAEANDTGSNYEEEEEVELNEEIPPPGANEKPKYTSLFMTGLQNNRLEQTAQVYQQMKAEVEIAPRVRNTFRSPANPVEFAQREEFKHRRDVRLNLLDPGDAKRASVTVFDKR